MADRRRWAIVLGAGDGTRLQALTRHAGHAVPKQYCTLDGGLSLYQLALDRAERVVSTDAIVTVVAERHECWWQRDLARLEPLNVIVQPENRGTAAGVLLPLLEVARRDPGGSVVLLPSDHWVESEGVLSDAIDRAFDDAERHPDRTLLLGISPDEPETGYGWIVPRAARTAAGSTLVRAVEAFEEKPGLERARQLMRRRALWNSFVLVASVSALLGLYARRLPHLPGLLATAADLGAPALRSVYATLESHDFCRDLLQGAERALGVVTVPPCGWTDLGTPLRVAECLRRGGRRTATDAAVPATDRVNLMLALGGPND